MVVMAETVQLILFQGHPSLMLVAAVEVAQKTAVAEERLAVVRVVRVAAETVAPGMVAMAQPILAVAVARAVQLAALVAEVMAD